MHWKETSLGIQRYADRTRRLVLSRSRFVPHSAERHYTEYRQLPGRGMFVPLEVFKRYVHCVLVAVSLFRLVPS